MTETVPVRRAQAAARDGRTARPRLARVWPAGAAVLAGLALLAAFPPVGWWWAAPVGVALLAVAVQGRGPAAGAGLGMVCGLALFTPLLAWTNLHTGTLPWLLLSVLEAGYVALLGAAGAWCTPLVARYRWMWPPVTGTLWVAQEALRDRTPFGGFPWGRLAFSQGDAPTLRLAALGGAPLVTFAVAAAGGLLALAAWAAVARRVPVAAGAGAAAVLVVLVGLAVPVGAPAGPRVDIAIVQGNVPRLGLDFNAQRRAVLDDHVDATLDLARAVRAGRLHRPVLVVWPENSSDIDPTANPDAAARIDQAAEAVGVPILVGSLTDGPGRGVRNVALLWRPGGPVASYTKRHPVPFAEYIPLRSLARRVSDKVDLVARDFVPGDRPGVLHTGAVTVGDVICFEVAYDNLVRDTVTGGGQVLVVQTNNATFNAAEARQQMAMVRLRAVEHGRAALMASTVGVSGFVDTAGGVHQATGFNRRAVIVGTVPLAPRRTLGTVLGSLPELVLAGLGLVVLGFAVWQRRGGRSGAGRRDERETA